MEHYFFISNKILTRKIYMNKAGYKLYISL